MGRSPGNFESLKPEDEMFSDFCHTVIQHTNNIRLRLSVSVKPAQALGAASDIAAQPGLSFLRGAKTKSTPPRKTKMVLACAWTRLCMLHFCFSCAVIRFPQSLALAPARTFFRGGVGAAPTTMTPRICFPSHRAPIPSHPRMK